jgi:serine protease inhibitor
MKSIEDILRFFDRRKTKVMDIAGGLERFAPQVLDSIFSLDFFRLVWDSGPGLNVCVSPFSVESVLALLYGGAGGETRTAIARALRMGVVEPGKLDRDYKDLLDEWRKASRAGDLQLAVANSLWTDKGFPIGKAFAARAREFYDAKTGEVDFSGYPERALRTVNAWVKDKTRNRIPSILDSVPPATRLALANAVYFKGLWDADAKFDRTRTRTETFHLLDGSRKRVPMMRRPKKTDLSYCRGEGFQAVVLPYRDTTLGMVLFLPDERRGLGDFLKDLKAENWERWVSEFEPTPGEVVLPRFKLECSYMLNAALAAMGMEVAFGPGADFGGISSEPVWIGAVRHRAFLEVNEEGSEAAAGTTGLMMLALPPPKPKEFKMVFDHPFFCAIVDGESDTILFASAVLDP